MKNRIFYRRVLILLALGLAGCSLEVIAPVNEAPEASFSVSPFSLPAEARETVVTLDASGSVDPEGEPLVYEWTVPEGIFASRSQRYSRTTQVTLSGGRAYEITLQVTDVQGASDTLTRSLPVSEAGPATFSRSVQPRFHGFCAVDGCHAVSCGCAEEPLDCNQCHAQRCAPGRQAGEETAGCAMADCHGAEEAGGLNLSQAQAYRQLVNVDSQQVPGLKRVKPGAPLESYLYHKLVGSHRAVGGKGNPMPLGHGWTEADTDVIRQWIEAGAPGD